MKPPEPLIPEFDVSDSRGRPPEVAAVLSLDEARARKVARTRQALYAAILESVNHIDITRGRRMALAREKAIY